MLNKQQVETLMSSQEGLMKQSYEQIPSLHTLSEALISRQATQNIGTIGHVAHGKSTLVKAISGVHTVKFHNEKIRNITIKLGYANSKIYKCPTCPDPQSYKSYGSSKEDDTSCKFCESKMVLQRHVSFVDCPGHDILMATMLTGAAVMDAALLLIAGNMSCPQPQTKEHLAAVEIMNLDHILIVQNKIDIIFKDREAASKNYEEIKRFVQDTKAQDSPIIPVSAQLQYNVDVVCQYLCQYFPLPIRDFSSFPKMIIIRSFDVNRPGIDIEQIQGGVAGGTILQGVLKVGDEIEIRPGIITKSNSGKVQCRSIFSRIITLKAENNELLYAGPGGLIGCGLKVDPTLTRSDKLVGHVLGHPNKLPDVYIELEVTFYLLKRLLGVKSEGAVGSQGQRSNKVRKIQQLETLMINVGSTQTGGKVTSIDKFICQIQLVAPVCTQKGEKVALSRRIDKKWRLIGWGEINKGTLIDTNVL